MRRALLAWLTVLPLALADGQPPVLIVLERDQVRAVDLDSGKTRWTYRAGKGARPTWFGGKAGTAYVSFAPKGDAPTLVALGPGGTPRWTTNVGGIEHFRVSGPLVQVKLAKTRLAIDGATGRVRWRLETPQEHIHPYGVSAESTLWSDGRVVYAYDARSGDPRWTRRFFSATAVPDPASEQCAVGPSGVYVVDTVDAAEKDAKHGILRALDPDTGAERWRKQVARHASPSAHGDRVYLADGASLTAFAARDGRSLWTVGAVRWPLGLDARQGLAALLSADNKQLRLIDLTSGKTRWTVEVPRKLEPHVDEALFGDDLVLIRSAGTSIALDRADGRHRWTRERDALLLVGPALVALVDNTRLRRVDPADGKTARWRADIGRWSTIGPLR